MSVSLVVAVRRALRSAIAAIKQPLGMTFAALDITSIIDEFCVAVET